MSYSGKVKNFNADRGFGNIDMMGQNVFVHMKDCIDGMVPQFGDTLVFDVEPKKSDPMTMQAKNVKGGSVPRTSLVGFVTPLDGTGAYSGFVKSFGQAGWGFVVTPEGQEYFMNIKDCVGTRPVQGDTVKFDLKPSDTKPGQMQATNITGGTAPLNVQGGLKSQFAVTPVEGNGKLQGVAKSFVEEGWGFVKTPDGTEYFMALKDCVGTRPVKGDVLRFDLRPSDRKDKEGVMQATNITGGTAPLVMQGQIKGGFTAAALQTLLAQNQGGGSYGSSGPSTAYGGAGYGGAAVGGALRRGAMIQQGPYSKGGAAWW